MVNNGKYLEIGWHGRVGQGVVTAAFLLAEVMAMEGKYVQAFPEFNRERNAPFVLAYNRLSESPIRLHSPVMNIDIAAIMDPAVILNANGDVNANGNADAHAMADANANTGMNNHFKTNTNKNTCYIVNTSLEPQLIHEKLNVPGSIVYTVDADTISREEMDEPHPNISLLTALIHCIAWIPTEHINQRLQESLSNRWTDNHNFNLASANSNVIERSLREIRTFTESKPAITHTESD